MTVNLTNELAKQRNRGAAERTLMAWIRTCLSLISFGFGLDKIVSAIRTQDGVVGHAGLGVRLVSMAFVLTGMAAMAASGRYGPAWIAAGIVATPELMLGDRAGGVLDAPVVAALAVFVQPEHR